MLPLRLRQSIACNLGKIHLVLDLFGYVEQLFSQLLPPSDRLFTFLFLKMVLNFLTNDLRKITI